MSGSYDPASGDASADLVGSRPVESHIEEVPSIERGSLRRIGLRAGAFAGRAAQIHDPGDAFGDGSRRLDSPDSLTGMRLSTASTLMVPGVQITIGPFLSASGPSSPEFGDTSTSCHGLPDARGNGGPLRHRRRGRTWSASLGPSAGECRNQWDSTPPSSTVRTGGRLHRVGAELVHREECPPLDCRACGCCYRTRWSNADSTGAIRVRKEHTVRIADGRRMASVLRRVRADRSRSGCVLPVPRPISLKNREIEIVRHRQPSVVFGPEGMTRSLAFRARYRRASVRRAGESAPVEWVVVPRFAPGRPTTFEPLPRARALLQLTDQSFNYNYLGARGYTCLATRATRRMFFDSSTATSMMCSVGSRTWLRTVHGRCRGWTWGPIFSCWCGSSGTRSTFEPSRPRSSAA